MFEIISSSRTLRLLCTKYVIKYTTKVLYIRPERLKKMRIDGNCGQVMLLVYIRTTLNKKKKLKSEIPSAKHCTHFFFYFEQN